ncbi:hypothetical protein C8R42DRAFT_723096 [Lentinula raphanica]|nr:hypothetical protein C8R42DRAFT_723096 [Lentinula raphanica]
MKHVNTSLEDLSNLELKTQLPAAPSKKRSREKEEVSENELKTSQKKKCECWNGEGDDPKLVIKDLQTRIRVLEAQDKISEEIIAKQKNTILALSRGRNKCVEEARNHERQVFRLERELDEKTEELKVKVTEAEEMERRVARLQNICQKTSGILDIATNL